MSPRSESSISSLSTNDTSSQQGRNHEALFANLQALQSGLGNPLVGGSLQLALDAAHRSGLNQVTSPPTSGASSLNSSSNCHSSSSQGVTPGKRANRTRFTDYQIKVLQEFFESNAYPKDDDLEYLSKLLNLSPRVIVVWFQNARQKARKVYENQPAAVPEDDPSGKYQRTPGLNYQCKKCMQVFQRYYELIKHQKSSCFKDENPLSAQLKAAAEARQAACNSPGNSMSSNPVTPNHNVSSGNSVSAANLVVNENIDIQRESTPQSGNSSSVNVANNVFRCEHCSLVFPRIELWKEHQLVHLMNPSLFGSYPSNSPFGMLQFEASQQAALLATQNQASGNSAGNAVVAAAAIQQQQQLVNQLQQQLGVAAAAVGGGLKRKLTQDDEDSQESHSNGGNSQTGSGIMSSTSVSNNQSSTTDPPRDKRLRTTILPEQLDYLYQKYQIESNPSRKMLDNIAKEVGLKKRVVQVWFQNTRARERKGQYRAHQQAIHKRCPFCRALFKARSALESHLATRHADQYTKGDINIDAIPDGEPEPEDMMDESKTPIPGNASNTGVNMAHDLVKQYYENMLGKKMLDDMSSALGAAVAGSTATGEQAIGGGSVGGVRGFVDSPLDLSKPVDLSSSVGCGSMKFGSTSALSEDDFGNYDYSRSEDGGDISDCESDNGNDLSGGDGICSTANDRDSPTDAMSTSGCSSVGTPGSVALTPLNCQKSGSTSGNGSAKRFRTQMTTVQLKVMKSIFADYKTPSMAECDQLGREIGLPKRVVQVWFQNARAKDKKAKLAMKYTTSSGVVGGNQDISSYTSDKCLADECKICGIKYNHKFSSSSMQDHLFSHKHIEKLRVHIASVKQYMDGADDSSTDFPGASSIVLGGSGGATGGGSGSGGPNGVLSQSQMFQFMPII